jgi:hypothetical protein
MLANLSEAEVAFDLPPKTTPLAKKLDCAVMGQRSIAVLKDVQAGVSVQDLCRKYGISDATFYKWWTKYAGLEVSDVKNLRQLEEKTGDWL